MAFTRRMIMGIHLIMTMEADMMILAMETFILLILYGGGGGRRKHGNQVAYRHHNHNTGGNSCLSCAANIQMLRGKYGQQPIARYSKQPEACLLSRQPISKY